MERFREVVHYRMPGQKICGMPMEPLGNCSELLVELLRQQGLPAMHEDGIVTLPEHPSFKLALNVYQGQSATIQMDAIFAMGPGKVINSEMERIARMYPGIMSKECFESIAHRSAEVHSFIQALETGHAGTEVRMLFPIIPFNRDAFEFVSKLPSARQINAEQAKTLKQVLNIEVKPRFRFPKLF